MEMPRLSPGAVRLKLDLLALSSNNVTYAAMGSSELGYWDFFPAPDGWGCPPCWGLATVVESESAEIEVGTRYYGYFPISELVDVIPSNVGLHGFSDRSPHRATKAAAYNLYHDLRNDPLYDAAFEPEQVLFRPVFSPGWWLADYIHHSRPSTVVLSSASSKSAIAMSWKLGKLSNCNSVALTSSQNERFVQDTGLYTQVLTYENLDLEHAVEPVAYVDFLGQDELREAVHRELGTRLKQSILFGATDRTAKPEGVKPPDVLPSGPAPEFFFTPGYAAKRIEAEPDISKEIQADTREFYRASRAFITIRQSAGVDAIVADWQRLLAGGVPPSEGLAFSF